MTIWFSIFSESAPPISIRSPVIGRFGQIETLIADACSVRKDSPDVDFEKLIAKQAEPSVLDDPGPKQAIPQRVYVANNESETCTILEIQAADRIGLLYDIFNVLSNLNAEVLSARNQHSGRGCDRSLLSG